MAKKKKSKPSPVSISTWARLRSAGKAPVGGKPYGAENMNQNPDAKKK